jgi:hypothetical protein
MEAGETAPAEPAEPAVRVDPQPTTAQTARPARRASSEVERPKGQPEGRKDPQQQKADDASSHEPASPAKRQRPMDPSVKIMPLKYETCDVKALGVLISDMLMELVRLNDDIPLRDGQLTRFHSRYCCLTTGLSTVLISSTEPPLASPSATT